MKTSHKWFDDTTSKTFGFLTFLGDIEMEQCPEMLQYEAYLVQEQNFAKIFN